MHQHLSLAYNNSQPQSVLRFKHLILCLFAYLSSTAFSFTDETAEAKQNTAVSPSIEIIYSEDNQAMLEAISALKSKTTKSLYSNEEEYEAYKDALLEQELLLIELNNSDFDRTGILPLTSSDFDWKENISVILQPLLASLSALTEKPRETSELESQTLYIKKRIKALEQGIKVLDDIKQEHSNNDENIATLTMISNYWKEQLEKAHLAKKLLKEKAAAIDRKVPISEHVNTSIGRSITKKALTLLWAFLAAAATFFAANYIASLFTKLEGRARTQKGRLISRIWHFTIRIFALLLAITSFFFVMYLRAEWLLLGIGLVVLFIIAIGLKDTLPDYLIEMRTMLNLGSVKEGERIIFKGIAWQVKSLGLYCHLHNPDLDAHAQISLAQLADMHSRPFHDDEPFFPTRLGDWVILSDGTRGYVELQSAENVILNSFASLITYATTDFLALSPKNLSIRDNIVTTVFGIDYCYQEKITTECLQQLTEFIRSAEKPDNYQNVIIDIKVDFKTANASSLDFLIIAIVSGAGAEYLFSIERWLQSVCVDAANHYGWTIPFQQITLHNE